MQYTSDVTWKRTTATKEVRITFDKSAEGQSEEGKRYYSHKHVTEYKDEEFAGTVEVTIDLDWIVRYMAGHAANNRTGRATSMGGRIKGKVIRKTLTRTGLRENPIPRGYSLLPEPGTVGGGPHPSEAVPYPVVNGVMYPNGKRGTE